LHAVPAEVRLYDRLFAVPFPGARNPWGNRGEGEPSAPGRAAVVAGDDDEQADDAERDYLDDLNPESKRVITALIEPSLVGAAPEDRVQFERHGYFVADIFDHSARHPVFNRAVTLRDSWTKPS
jgi:glutaminyl-tRNA synthetase